MAVQLALAEGFSKGMMLVALPQSKPVQLVDDSVVLRKRTFPMLVTVMVAVTKPSASIQADVSCEVRIERVATGILAVTEPSASTQAHVHVKCALNV